MPTPERMPTRDEPGSAGKEMVSSVEKLQRELMELLELPTRQPALGKHSRQGTPLRELNAGPLEPVRAASLDGSGRKLTLDALASYRSHRLGRGEPAEGGEVSIFKNAHRNRIHNRASCSQSLPPALADASRRQEQGQSACSQGAQTPHDAAVQSQMLELTSQKCKAETLALLSTREYNNMRKVCLFLSTCLRTTGPHIFESRVSGPLQDNVPTRMQP